MRRRCTIRMGKVGPSLLLLLPLGCTGPQPPEWARTWTIFPSTAVVSRVLSTPASGNVSKRDEVGLWSQGCTGNGVVVGSCESAAGQKSGKCTTKPREGLRRSCWGCDSHGGDLDGHVLDSSKDIAVPRSALSFLGDPQRVTPRSPAPAYPMPSSWIPTSLWGCVEELISSLPFET